MMKKELRATTGMVNLGIIGMGYTGQQHLQVSASVPQLQVSAVAETRAEQTASLGGELRIYTDWRALLADPEIQAVSLCLPHVLHAEVALAALAAGKHLLIEKPLAIDLQEAEDIVAAAEKTDRVVMVEMTHRFYPPVQAGRALVQAGRLGPVFAVEERIVQPLQEGDLPNWMFARNQAGGGVALTNGIHMLDRIAWVCGQELQLRGAAAGWTQGWGDVEDTAAMQLSLADGTPALLLASWPRSVGPADDELTIYGTRGTLRIWAWRGWAFEPADAAREEHASYPPEADLPARARVGMTGALEEFARAIVEGREAHPTAREILPAHQLIDQFYRQVGTAGK